MFAYGRLKSTDERNALHPMHRALGPVAALTVPQEKTWGFTGKVLDQGQTGTCTAHAGAHFIHASPISHKGFLDPFQLYREAVLLDEYDDNDSDATAPTPALLQAGSSGTGVAKALAKRGVISEYLWAQRMEDAVTWVLTRGPVMVGSNWYASMEDPTPEGMVRIGVNSAIVGGHEWLIRGADKDKALVLCVNSWGPGWGGGSKRWKGRAVPAGHFLLDFDTLARLFHEDGDAVSALEKKPGK
jgi:hypothetical protein